MAKNTSTAFLISISLLWLAPLGAYATQGACSYHSGVNCSAGANYNGNVTCNDGWVNSSVLYSDADECKSRDLCPSIVYGMTCNTESDYARVQQKVDNMRGQQSAINGRRGIPWDASSIGQDELDSCRQSIGLFDRMVAARNQCENERASQTSQEAKNFERDFELSRQSKLDAFCLQYHGIGSVWDNSMPPDDITAQCTQSRDAQIDAAFQKAFKSAMDNLPEYTDIVEPDVIKKLSLDPVNGNKTFAQIIIERYGDELAAKKVLEIQLAEKTRVEDSALNSPIEPPPVKLISNTKQKSKKVPPAILENEVKKVIDLTQYELEAPRPAIIKTVDTAPARPVKGVWWKRIKSWFNYFT